MTESNSHQELNQVAITTTTTAAPCVTFKTNPFTSNNKLTLHHRTKAAKTMLTHHATYARHFSLQQNGIM